MRGKSRGRRRITVDTVHKRGYERATSTAPRRVIIIMIMIMVGIVVIAVVPDGSITPQAGALLSMGTLGALSDVHGRKPFMLLSALGMAIAVGGTIAVQICDLSQIVDEIIVLRVLSNDHNNVCNFKPYTESILER